MARLRFCQPAPDAASTFHRSPVNLQHVPQNCKSVFAGRENIQLAVAVQIGHLAEYPQPFRLSNLPETTESW